MFKDYVLHLMVTLWLVSLAQISHASDPSAPVGEYFTASPVLHDGTLYVGSVERTGHRGHLRAIDLQGGWPVVLWDAASHMPVAADDALHQEDSGLQVAHEERGRSLFTNLGSRPLSFTVNQAAQLNVALGASSPEAAATLIQVIRGQSELEPMRPAPLWGISRSSPAVVGESRLVPGASQRDRIVYAGGEDGMLHAFRAETWDSQENGYGRDARSGTELWAYLPGSLLAELAEQPPIDSPLPVAIHADGPPAVVDLFYAPDQDGRRVWKTVLVSTASMPARNQGSVFALDVTDPHRPALLWEHPLPGAQIGLTRGVIVADHPGHPVTPATLYFTAAMRSVDDSGYRLHACAIDLVGGRLLWQFTSPAAAEPRAVNATPAIPALLQHATQAGHDYLVFGDLAGRLWLLDTTNGEPLNNAPAFIVPEKAAEPIGASVTVLGNLILFGTGGAAHADDNRTYAVYALQFDPAGLRLLWRYELNPGEKVWERPNLDNAGHIYISTSDGIPYDFSQGHRQTSGRLIVLDKDGVRQEEVALGTGAHGTVTLGSGIALVVSVTGEAVQLGPLQPDSEQTEGPVQLVTWRLR